MIDERLAALIEGPVMIILAVADRVGCPTIARAVGARFDTQSRSISVLVSRRQWPVLTGALALDVQIAVTFCRATDYTSYQVKGRICRIAEPDVREHDLAARYVTITGETLGALGVGQALIDQWVPSDDIVCLDFAPEALFLQTPGPGAGQVLEAQ